MGQQPVVRDFTWPVSLKILEIPVNKGAIIHRATEMETKRYCLHLQALFVVRYI
jgi:hypothetical protein